MSGRTLCLLACNTCLYKFRREQPLASKEEGRSNSVLSPDRLVWLYVTRCCSVSQSLSRHVPICILSCLLSYKWACLSEKWCILVYIVWLAIKCVARLFSFYVFVGLSGSTVFLPDGSFYRNVCLRIHCQLCRGWSSFFIYRESTFQPNLYSKRNNSRICLSEYLT